MVCEDVRNRLPTFNSYNFIEEGKLKFQATKQHQFYLSFWKCAGIGVTGAIRLAKHRFLI
jgi:hypothetical protein